MPAEPEEDPDEILDDNKHPESRKEIRNEIISLAKEYLAQWDELEDVAYVSEKYGFRFEARQTQYEGQVLTVAHSVIPGMTLEKHAQYRANMGKLIE